MKNSSLSHSVFLLISLFLTLIFLSRKELADYSLQLTAFLIVFLVISHKIFTLSSFLMVESIISTISIVLVTSTTGGLSSPFFFLNHFLLFELSLLLEPEVPVILTLGLMVFYLFSFQVGSSFNNLIYLSSFIFMTPLAFFAGNAYKVLKTPKLN